MNAADRNLPPQTKPSKTIKTPKPMNRSGKRTDAWEKVRRVLKPQFERAGITTCELGYEGCWHDNGLGFAHAKRRRNLGPGELSVVILACNHCHDKLDLLPADQTEAAVMETIQNRKIQPAKSNDRHPTNQRKNGTDR